MNNLKTILLAAAAVSLLAACADDNRAVDTSSSYETGATNNSQYQSTASPEPMVRETQSK